MRVSRRGMLAGAGSLAGLGLLGGAGALLDVLPGGSGLRSALGLTGDDGTVPDVRPGTLDFHRRYSTARGAEVDLMVTAPPDVRPDALPVCLALHPLRSSARGLADLGLPQFVTDAAIRRATGPFAVVAPDGGQHFWYDAGDGADPQAMLRDELPGWLDELGLALPTAVLGMSMGGFGALGYAHERMETGAPLAATAAMSPALFAHWESLNRQHAAPAKEIWAANDPLQHPDRRVGRTLGVWCGTADRFYENSRIIAQLAKAELASFEPGGHNAGYWRRILPDVVDFIGGHLRR
ncbi:hypothetical protein IQ251_08545 [Saccharopolyspora sp. HNM0983]|uniref:Acyl-CoA:diacylglycerol acyltransferase n=1 Tax=Saccharopolyspora montiporae TaxID=2781240 RepID=A0A929FZE8_9PSEU|nr:alpha/beta hydrolase-fold protein [Saccharopolyspora sp. HNM0983]MBE9374495.1 hypothetical protein [Saccharopolyspora sp. HNM0983]